MTIPVAPLYPDAFDSDTNLYVVHDSLRVTLVEDYLPGKKFITVTGDTTNFPSTGLLTLTEQQSDIEDRAISFYYSSKTATTFEGLELLPGFVDVAKPKNITHVTQNVMAAHHKNLKDAVIAIEEFIGVKGTVDLKPLGVTMEGRINFLRKLVLRPRAWFTANKRIGIRPLTVEFKDLSFRNPTGWCWNFGDNTGTSACSVSGISVPSSLSGVSIPSIGSPTITKTYFNAGIYDVTLTVSNEFGEDTITIPNYIVVRVGAPDPATIDFTPDITTQTYIGGVLTTRSNAIVNVAVDDNGEQPGDPITNYTWDLQDDLLHPDSPQTRGLYTIGGRYDIRLKVGTTLGAYRTTIFPGVVNVIERSNLFLMVSPDTTTAITKNFYAYEFGLLSETFKTGTRSPVSVTRDYTIVQTQTDSVRAVREFKYNNGFVKRNQIGSGDQGTALVYWTEGGSPIQIRFKEYTAFTDTWANPPGGLTTQARGWNWASFNSTNKVYFMFGTGTSIPPNTPGNSPTNQVRDSLNLASYTFTTPVTFTSTNYKNGADELMQNVGLGSQGDFSVYRTCWKDNTGFMVRNDGVGPYFRLKSFYRTEGTLTDEFQSIRKLPDMPGTTKYEGQLVPLSGGVYFFNNSGEVVVWNDVTSIWAVGQPAASSTPFRSLQDQSVASFDDPTNRLVATSDGNNMAYLSFDYTDRCFLKFNQATLVFSSLGSRPSGEQLLMGLY